jgi:hypothetical protein
MRDSITSSARRAAWAARDGLLRARRERPRSRRAAEQRDEMAAFHSITSSPSSKIETRPRH